MKVSCSICTAISLFPFMEFSSRPISAIFLESPRVCTLQDKQFQITPNCIKNSQDSFKSRQSDSAFRPITYCPIELLTESWHLFWSYILDHYLATTTNSKTFPFSSEVYQILFFKMFIFSKFTLTSLKSKQAHKPHSFSILGKCGSIVKSFEWLVWQELTIKKKKINYI